MYVIQSLYINVSQRGFFFLKLLYEKIRDSSIFSFALCLGLYGDLQSFPISLESITFFHEFLQEHTLGNADLILSDSLSAWFPVSELPPCSNQIAAQLDTADTTLGMTRIF